MEGAQSFRALYRVDFCCEPEGNSQEEMVGVDIERKSALYELALHRVDQVSGQKNRHFPYKRGRDVFCGACSCGCAWGAWGTYWRRGLTIAWRVPTGKPNIYNVPLFPRHCCRLLVDCSSLERGLLSRCDDRTGQVPLFSDILFWTIGRAWFHVWAAVRVPLVRHTCPSFIYLSSRFYWWFC